MAIAFVSAAAFATPSVAAEVELLGTGTFKPPSADAMVNVPVGLPFTQADLSSGKWSFVAHYEDGTPDSDPDPYVGRYRGAVRAFRLTVGSTSVDVPADETEIVVSDGGLGYAERESVRLQVSARTPFGVMRVSWIQIHQTATRTDLRGAPGLLAGDGMPSPSILANLPTERTFDRFLLLRVDAPAQAQPLLYLASTSMSVTARPVPAAR